MVNQLVDKKQHELGETTGRQVSVLHSLYDKIKSIKHIKIIAIALAGALALLIFAAAMPLGKAAAASDPMRELEARLAVMLSGIEGAGKVEVMIMFDGGMGKEIAYTTEVTTNKVTDANGNYISEDTIESSTPVMVNENGQSKPIVLKELLPDILGVMIVAEGAKDVGVRMELMRASSKILNVNSNIIEIFTKQK
ncbi:MAG: hypothetical protein LBT30_04400 [Clostridiales bacterium]|jgi:stage III sporulation protein AG|nr:hypothetical protein [Clostridiales bacterium]